MFPLIDLMAPLRATANRCGLDWAAPFFLYEADKLQPQALETAAIAYARSLADGIAASPATTDHKAA